MSDGPTSIDGVRPKLEELVGRGEYRAALRLFRGMGTQAPSADAGELMLLAATAAARLGDLGYAARLAREALPAFERESEGDGRLRALNLLGAVAFEQGRLDEAETAFRDVLASARARGDALMLARASNNLASLAHLRGDPSRAVVMYYSALEGYAALNDPRGLAEAYHNLGLAYRHLRAWRDAVHAADEAVHHATLQGDRGLIGLALMGRAEIMIERGHWDLARQALDRAGTLTAEAGDEMGQCEVERIRALLALHQGDAAEALRVVEGAMATAVRLESTLLRAECCAVSALANRVAGDSTAAQRAHDEALEGFRRLGARDLLERFQREWATGAAVAW